MNHYEYLAVKAALEDLEQGDINKARETLETLAHRKEMNDKERNWNRWHSPSTSQSA